LETLNPYTRMYTRAHAHARTHTQSNPILIQILKFDTGKQMCDT